MSRCSKMIPPATAGLDHYELCLCCICQVPTLLPWQAVLKINTPSIQALSVRSASLLICLSKMTAGMHLARPSRNYSASLMLTVIPMSHPMVLRTMSLSVMFKYHRRQSWCTYGLLGSQMILGGWHSSMSSASDTEDYRSLGYGFSTTTVHEQGITSVYPTLMTATTPELGIDYGPADDFTLPGPVTSVTQSCTIWT